MTHPRRRWPEAAEILVLAVLAAAPMLATAIRVADSWRAVGDTAAITLRSLDVFTRHSPLIGMPTTLSDTLGQTVHHPGPLEFWAIAIGEALGGGRLAPMFAVVAVNLAAIVAMVAFAGWIGGRPARVATALVLALATWSLRGDIVIDPYNPYAAWLPLGAFAIGLAATIGGRLWALPVAIAAGSYAAQAHVSLLFPVAMATGVAIVVVAVDAGILRTPRTLISRMVTALGEHRLVLITSVAVAVVCWAPVLIDLLFGQRNLLTLVRAADNDGPVFGVARAWQVVARAVTSPPWLVADRDPYTTVASVPPIQQFVAAIILIMAGGLAWHIWRRRRGVAALLVVAVAGLGGGVVANSRIPDGVFSTYALHNYLWLWSFTALLGVGIGGAVWVASEPLRNNWSFTPPPWSVPAVLGVVTLVVALLGVVTEPARPSVLAGRHAPAVEGLSDQLAAILDPSQPVVVDIHADIEQSSVTMGLVLELQRRGFETRVPDALSNSFGAHRVQPLEAPGQWIYTAIGYGEPYDRHLPPDTEVLATHIPDQARLDRLEAASNEVIEVAREAGGMVIVGQEELTDMERVGQLVRQGEVVSLVNLGLLVHPTIPDDVFRRYVQAQNGPVLFATVFRYPDTW